MKKMLMTKAKEYARQLLNLEESLSSSTDKKEQIKIQNKIESIVDEVCEIYEPTAMYKIDEQMYILEKSRKTLQN